MATTVMFKDRHEMIRELFRKGGIIAEVGVQFGRFAQAIYDECSPSHLVLVDPWKHIIGDYEKDPCNVSDREHEQRFWECVGRFKGNTRVEIIRRMSFEVAATMPIHYFDGVYLDADHTRDGITRDINDWWQLVRPGGVLAGHDYCVTPWIDVRSVVDAFADLYGYDIMLSGEEDWKSWAIRKPNVDRL